jgi:hypothetical protein
VEPIFIYTKEMFAIMTIDEIRAKYDAGGYTYKVNIPSKVCSDHVFDEELSVKRNRELVLEHNDNVDQLRRDRNRIQHELDEQLTYDVIVYMMEYYDLTERQAKIVENFVYQHYHSSMSDYFGYIDAFADFAFLLTEPKEGTND